MTVESLQVEIERLSPRDTDLLMTLLERLLRKGADAGLDRITVLQCLAWCIGRCCAHEFIKTSGAARPLKSAVLAMSEGFNSKMADRRP